MYKEKIILKQEETRIIMEYIIKYLNINIKSTLKLCRKANRILNKLKGDKIFSSPVWLTSLMVAGKAFWPGGSPTNLV